MMLGLSPSAFTLLHVLLSLAGIGAGLVVLAALLRGASAAGWTEVFLVATIATSATGFLFPFGGVLPAHVMGALSLVALATAMVALYGRQLAGRWRAVFAAMAMVALYFNCFIAVAQLFLKVPVLHDLAPTLSEAPFLAAELVLLALFLWLGWRVVRVVPAEPGAAPVD